MQRSTDFAATADWEMTTIMRLYRLGFLLVFLVAGCAGPHTDVTPKQEVRVLRSGAAPKQQFAAARGTTSASVPLEGTASYYGPGFDGKKTASGETFSKNAMTAAHRTLPFGTKVRVTSLKSGKSVVVRINDRHPGTKGRVIDLSEGAFKQIAPLEAGIVRVKMEILKQ